MATVVTPEDRERAHKALCTHCDKWGGDAGCARYAEAWERCDTLGWVAQALADKGERTYQEGYRDCIEEVMRQCTDKCAVKDNVVRSLKGGGASPAQSGEAVTTQGGNLAWNRTTPVSGEKGS